MPFYFGKKMPMAPELAGDTSAFGRYLRYGRRSAFGRQYFGRYPLFGKKKIPALPGPSDDTGAMEFGRRRYRRRVKRKGNRKSKRPSKSLLRMCRKHGIKCTRKVGRKRVYKLVSVLKRQLRRKGKQQRLHKQLQHKLVILKFSKIMQFH